MFFAQLISGRCDDMVGDGKDKTCQQAGHLGHISVESDSSAGSGSVVGNPYLLGTPNYFATKQRVGSLRSRLKKQHPILLSDSDPNPEFLITSVDREEAAAAAAAAAANSRVRATTTTTAETHEWQQRHGKKSGARWDRSHLTKL